MPNHSKNYLFQIHNVPKRHFKIFVSISIIGAGLYKRRLNMISMECLCDGRQRVYKYYITIVRERVRRLLPLVGRPTRNAVATDVTSCWAGEVEEAPLCSPASLFICWVQVLILGQKHLEGLSKGQLLGFCLMMS